MSKFYLGKVIPFEQTWTGEPISEITAEKKNEIFANIGFVPFFYACRQIRNITIESGNDFITYCESMAKTNIVYSETEMVDLLTTANKLLISYLSFLQIFFDITSHELAKKSKVKKAEFRDKEKTFCDQFFSYRFLSRLRNYVVHYAIPIVVVGSYSDGVSFSISKKELLKYNEWSSIKAEISRLPEQIYITQYVPECNHVIDLLYLDALLAILEEVSVSSIYLRNTFEHYQGNVFAIGEEKEGLITWSKLPLHLLKEYIDEIKRSENIHIS